MHEKTGPRSNNYEHMLKLVPMSGSPESAMIATLLYIKQYPQCEAYRGTEGIKDRPRNAYITRTLEWTADQEVPFSVILSDNPG